MTHYQILGVHQDASAHAIKLAYRRFAKIYHPDRGRADDDKMQRLNEAYAVLSKPDKRKAYDESLKNAPLQYDHPTGETKVRRAPETTSETPPERPRYKSRSEELQAEINSAGFLKRIRDEYSNRFESKDAFLAVTLAFFAMMSSPVAYLKNPGNILVSWPFFLAALVGGLAGRYVAKFYFLDRFKGGPESMIMIILSNAAAAFMMGAMAKLIEIFLKQSLFAHPITPALLAAIFPGAVGAGIGRAFNRTMDPLTGFGVGAFVGGTFAVFFGLWCVVAQLPLLGTGASSEALAKPLQAVIFASALAGGLGSFRMKRLFIFSMFDWLETWFERFAPKKALVKESK